MSIKINQEYTDELRGEFSGMHVLTITGISQECGLVEARRICISDWADFQTDVAEETGEPMPKITAKTNRASDTIIILEDGEMGVEYIAILNDGEITFALAHIAMNHWE